MPSVVFNLATALLVFTALAVHIRKNPLSRLLRYFTVLSNVFCALVSLALAITRLRGAVPVPLLLLKYVATHAVTVTLLTVLVFLGPQFGYKPLFSGPDFLLHLLCPLLALVSFLAWDRPQMTPLLSLIGVLPVLLYGFLYLRKVVYAKAWEDFYGFNRGGKWPVSFVAMQAGSFLVCMGLMALQNI